MNLASVCRRARTGVVAWSLVALIVFANGQRSLGQNGQEWIGRRVITKFGAVLRVGKQVVDNEKLENTARGGVRGVDRIYRVEQVNVPWLWLQDEKSSAAGWVKAEWVVPYDQALEYFTNEIRANPNDSSAYIRRGHIWRDKKEFDIAVADLGEAIRLDPVSEVAWCSRGNVWSDKAALKGHKDQALAHFRWVRDHGNPTFYEYEIALAELERVEKPAAKSSSGGN